MQNPQTLNDLFDLYLELYSDIRSPNTISSKKYMWESYVRNAIGTKNVRTLNFIHYQNFFNSLLKKLKPKTVKNMKSDMQVCVNLAVRLGIIQENPLKYIEFPPFDNKVYFTLPIEEQKRIFQAILNHKEFIYRNIFLFLAHGRRLNEALSLKWKHVDLENNRYHIPSSLNKTRKNMSYEMTETLRSVFLYQLYLAKKHDYYSLDSYVFFNPQTKNRFIDIRRAWRRFLKSNNLPKMRIHDIRHLVGTYSINYLNLPIEKVSHTLGHTNILTTQRYVTKRPKTAKEVIDNILISIKGVQKWLFYMK